MFYKAMAYVKKYWKRCIIVLLVSIVVFYISREYLYPLVQRFSDFEYVRNFITKYEKHSIVVFIVLHVLQVVIFIIPGEVVQISGGYLFGTLRGFIYSITGITIGSYICFYLARTLGKRFVGKIISKENLLYYEEKLNKKSYRKALFILYLIPGVPKDLLAYIAGISNIPLWDFIIISTVARVPALFLSSYFGENIIQRDIKSITIMCIIVIIIVIASIIYKEKIMNFINKHKK